MKDGVYEMVLHRRLPHKPLVTFSSAEEQLSALLAFEVDYIVMTRTTYNRLLRDTKTILPVVEDDMIGTFYEHGIGIGFQKNSKGETLARLFNEALKLLNVESIVHRYDLAPDWQKTLSSQKTFTQKSHQLLVIIVLLLILTSYIWHKQSITDSLTKLHNRAALYRKHKEGLPKDLVLIYFDINKFKVINDSFGHRAGEMVLKTVADNIKSHWRYDSYRIGGDEFILIGWIKHSQIESYLKKMTCFEFDDGVNEPYEVTVSYGCYISNGDHLSLDECIHKADTEMYRFKAA